MNQAPGVVIREQVSAALTLTSSATAVPVFVGRFKAGNALEAGKCIKVHDWLEFSKRFIGATAEVTFSEPKKRAKSRARRQATAETVTDGTAVKSVSDVTTFVGGGSSLR